MRRILLIANRTATTTRLQEVVAGRAARGDAEFHLVVPATPRGLHRVVDPEVTGRVEAAAQMQSALLGLAEVAGIQATGEVGDADPLAAIHDALTVRDYDEIVISTLPRRLSRWLHVDLVSKARGLGLPVTHVEAAAPSVELAAA